MNKKLVILMILVSISSYVALIEIDNYLNPDLHDMPLNMQDLEGLTGITCSSSISTEKKCTATTDYGKIIDWPVETIP